MHRSFPHIRRRMAGGLLTVVGDTTPNADMLYKAVRLGDYIYAVGNTCLVKFDLKLNVVAAILVTGTSDYQGLATDGTHLYVSTFGSEATHSHSIRLFKFDTSLNQVAQKAFDSPGTAVDYSHQLVYNGGSLYHFCGMNGDAGSTVMRLHCSKINPADLSLVANKSYYNGAFDCFYGAKLLTSGSMLAVGLVKLSKYAGYVSVWDTTPTVTAHKVIGGDASDVYFLACAETGGHYFVVGQAGANGVILKLDTSLNVVAQKTIGSSNATILNGIDEDAAGNLVVCGSTTVYTSGANNDVLVMKLDTDLNVLDQVGLGSTGQDYGNFVLSVDGVPYVFGAENGRDAAANGLVAKPPKTLAKAKVSGLAYLSAKTSSLAASTSSLTVAAPSLSSVAETITVWTPTTTTPAYSDAVASQGRL